MSEAIAIVGMACRYPDAASPAELWENVLARRQAFRRIPESRMRLDDYWSDDPAAPDRTYSTQAAVLTGYRFDRAAFRISRETYESTDVAHWLALDIAAKALADAGFEPPAATTGVIVGNTLTGDASRAGSLRLRWPFVRRMVGAALGDEGWEEGRVAAFLESLEARFKAPFPPVTEDTLAGGLANTIAGRICNHFGFRGGGYTIDGACASSLLAVAQACSALESGTMDVALAGGVDLSLDPFELIGFAKCTALARGAMRVFDRRAEGFLPGEGCGFVVLMRRSDALRAGRRIHAAIAGWGISSDGHGGMTRPEMEGQKLAISRAMRKAHTTPAAIRLFEAHGTGTPTGDTVEIGALLSLLGDDTAPHYVGSIKANIGHTKAAAGIAGLLKATMAVQRGIIPPATGCGEPREELLAPGAPLRVPARAMEWHETGRRAGVSAFGFGGINAHVIVEHDQPAPRMSARERQMAASYQDSEVFLFDGTTADEVLRSVAAVAERAPSLSLAELGDLADELRRRVVPREYRLAIVASSPDELHARGTAALHGEAPGVFRGLAGAAPRVAFLFSSPVRFDAQLWSARFPQLALDELTSSLAALRVLRHLGIEACCAMGRDAGEITALAWAGAFRDDQALALAAERDSLIQALEPAGATTPLGALVRDLRPAPLQRRVISTVTGAALPPDCDVAALLVRQLTAPVLIDEALAVIRQEADLLLDVGPILECFAAAFAAGCDVDIDALFADRFTRRYELGAAPVFLESPCERAPRDRESLAPRSGERVAEGRVRGAHPDASTESLLLQRIAAHLELPADLISPSSRMLSDLHLSSITVGRIVGEVARSVGAAPLADPTLFADATIAEAALAIEQARGAGRSEERPIEGVGDWVQPFVVAEEHVPLRRARSRGESGSWRFLGEIPDALRQRFAGVEGRGIVVGLTERSDAAIEALLAASRELGEGMRLVVAQEQPVAGGLARSLFLEREGVSVRIVNVGSLACDAAHIAGEAEGEGAFCEATYLDGERLEPRVKWMPPAPGQLAPGGTLLVTGGGKGIAVEAAIGLARAAGMRLALIGRSDPARDEELAANLARMRAERIAVTYAQADVTDAAAVARAVAGFGPIDALLHAAGNNDPALLAAIDLAAVHCAVAPKVDGLRNVLAACDPERLRFVIAFGSVIARCGMQGEAHYALANDWLAAEIDELARRRPTLPTLCIEWSVWAGVGMGRRLDRIDALRRRGVTPIAPEDAVRLTAALVSSGTSGRVIACGRIGNPPTLAFEGTVPLLRFLDRPRTTCGTIEIVADAELSASSDPYLSDHVLRGEPLLPGVVGLEAMAQAATALGGSLQRAEEIELRRPVVVPAQSKTTVRVAALRSGERIDVVLRSEETEYRLDHFRASFVQGARTRESAPHPDTDDECIDPAAVYRALLFHGPLFQRVTAYRTLSATTCVADVESRNERWFHRYLPQDLLLGDPAVRDAAIHALQACVPQATVVPVAIASIDFLAPLPADRVRVFASEVRRERDAFEWDVDLVAVDGTVVERWRGLRLQVVARRESFDDLPHELWGPLLERELGVDGLRIAVAAAPADLLIRRMANADPHRGVDGKPHLPLRDRYTSAAHAGRYTLAIVDRRPAGCDLEPVGEHAAQAIAHTAAAPLASLVAREAAETPAAAATRVWTACEAIKKASGNGSPPLVLDSVAGRRVAFTAAPYRIETFSIAGHAIAVARTNPFVKIQEVADDSRNVPPRGPAANQ